VLKYGIPVADLVTHVLDAVDAAERARARTLVTRSGQAIAAIVPMTDFDKVDPPDPAAGATGDPLLALCGSCHHDAFVDAFVQDFSKTALWRRG
jgi:antitoxin (DNA-binding transcriptional repressor) of toxin-antitoxin stability system